MGRRLRVLDVALGDGAQALRLARGGHQVTGLESDPGRLATFSSALETEPEGIRARFRALAGSGQDTGAHFLPGTFDVVLCHGVLDRAKDPDSTLAGLARVLDTGGLLSLVIPNAAARAMRPGLAGDWRAARAALVAQPGESDRFLRLEALTSFLARIGVPMECWYGVGVFAADGSPGAGTGAGQEQAADAADEAAADVEELACRTDPYRGVAPSLHLFGVRG